MRQPVSARAQAREAGEADEAGRFGTPGDARLFAWEDGVNSTLAELPYPDLRPRGKYCAKRHKCAECDWPADYLGKENGASVHLFLRHVGDWAEKRGLEIPVRKAAA